METAPLDREHVDRIIEDLRKRIANSGIGITVGQDHNGAWGRAGTTNMTLRFSHNKDLVQVSFELVQVSSSQEDAFHEARMNEDK